MRTYCFYSYEGRFKREICFYRDLTKLFNNLPFSQVEKYSIRNKLNRLTKVHYKGLTVKKYQSNQWSKEGHLVTRYFFENEGILLIE